jgi:hypothetical protein
VESFSPTHFFARDYMIYVQLYRLLPHPELLPNIKASFDKYPCDGMKGDDFITSLTDTAKKEVCCIFDGLIQYTLSFSKSNALQN